jgi:thiosulfate/3-mercaptopyruvate sulfurtransferase
VSGVRTRNSGVGTPPGAVPLVDVGWLAQRQPDPGLALVEVGADSAFYYTDHLPGARPLDWYDELHDPVRRGPVSQAGFEALMDRKGIRRQTEVVLYSPGDPSYAAYAYWVLRYYRHPCVSLLDGGRSAWVRAGHRLEERAAEPPATSGYRSPGPDETVRVCRDELLRAYVGAPSPALVLDCRTPVEYSGRSRHLLDLAVDRHRVRGHVPGARNLPSALVLTDEGVFRPRDQLALLVAERGVAPDSDVVAYCRTGERSALLWYTLSELLGHRRVRHYDGGWAEYGSLLDVPVHLDE